MLEFCPLNLENLPAYKQDILASEAIFPLEIRETVDTYREALAQPGLVAHMVYHQGAYAGNVVGFTPCPHLVRELRLDEIAVATGGLIYLFNIVAMPEFQGCGLGKRMLGHFLERSRQSGYDRVGGHFRGNGSLKNFLDLGAQVLAEFDDWFGTGESYMYCELPLRVPVEAGA